jgi:hypothetical protein
MQTDLLHVKKDFFPVILMHNIFVAIFTTEYFESIKVAPLTRKVVPENFRELLCDGKELLRNRREFLLDRKELLRDRREFLHSKRMDPVNCL